VVGTEDRVIPPDTQRRMAERAGATITEVAGSHVSMVSNPQATIDAILAAVYGTVLIVVQRTLSTPVREARRKGGDPASVAPLERALRLLAFANVVLGLAVVADVARSADVARMIETTIAKYGRIDIVVNNAMKIVPGKLEALPEESWDTTMNIGLKGAFLVSQAAARHMIAQKSGCIVNIASIAGLFPYNWAGAYSVVKAGLIMLTKLQAMEWAPYGIRANAITPGYIRTPGTEAMYADAEIYEGRRKGVPMGRVGTGEDIAGPAIFLASDDARYTTGSVLGADGGQAVGYFLSVPGRRFSGGRID